MTSFFLALRQKPKRQPIRWLLVFGLWLAASSAFASTLTKVESRPLSGDRLELRLSFDNGVPQVRGYGIERPARISLDLLQTKNAVTPRRQRFDSGNTQSMTIVEADERTRLIFNLEALTGYDTREENGQLVVVLGQAEQQPERHDAPRGASLNAVDFRRGRDGQGRVLINLSDASTPVDVRQQGAQVIARFRGVRAEDNVLRRLDVTDFATPVTMVATRRIADGLEMVIDAQGEWEYLAYQADNEFSIDIKPVVNVPERLRQQEEDFTGEKLSLNFQDIEVRSVLQLIADFTSLNLVASDTVTGRITLRLQNVPWDQALQLILRTKGLDKRQVGNVLLVAPAGEIAEREQQELESQRQQQALAPLRTRFININYANATELRTIIASSGEGARSLLSERGSVVVDQRTNTLVLQDTDAKLEEILDLISQLDVPVRQVLIEARVVIATNDLSNEFGVRWGGLGFDGNSLVNRGRTGMVSGRMQSLRDLHFTNFDRAGGTLEFQEFDPTQNNDLVVDLGVDSSSATRVAVGFTSLASGLLELELSALEAEGHGELIATPKVLTTDQQTAVIASGQQIPFEVAADGGGTGIELIDAELRLEVTPAITPDGNIIMQLKINNDSLAPDGSQAINTNRVETSVLVNDGETVVLGGIFQQEKVKSVTKTPFLGDLPWIGRLFRRTLDSDRKQELMIFITPRLMNDSAGQ